MNTSASVVARDPRRFDFENVSEAAESAGACSRRSGNRSNWPAASRRGPAVNINPILKDKEQTCHPTARN